MTGKAILAWYGYLAIMPQNHLKNVTVTGPARSVERIENQGMRFTQKEKARPTGASLFRKPEARSLCSHLLKHYLCGLEDGRNVIPLLQLQIVHGYSGNRRGEL